MRDRNGVPGVSRPCAARGPARLGLASLVVLAALFAATATAAPAAGAGRDPESGAAREGAAPVLRETPDDTAPADPKGVIEEIRTRSPELRAIDGQVEAAAHVVPRVGTLPDPTFGVGLSNLPFSTDTTPLTGVQLDLRQSFPWFGTLSLREALAAEDVEAFKNIRKDVENRIVAQGLAQLWEIRYQAEQRRIALEIQVVLRQFAEVAEATYVVGNARQQDLIRPIIEVHRIDTLLERVDRQMDILRSEINALRSRPPALRIDSPKLPDDIAPGPPLDVEKLSAYAARINPMLRVRDAEIRKQRVAIRLAHKAYYPDLSVGLQYRIRWVDQGDAVNGADFVGVTLGMSLPVYTATKQSEQVDEAGARLRSAEFQRRNTWNQIRDAIERIVRAIERDRVEAGIYQSRIIPDTDKALESSLNDYQTGNIEFLTVLDNLMTLFRAKVELIRRTTRIELNLARLSYVLGGPIEEAVRGVTPKEEKKP